MTARDRLSHRQLMYKHLTYLITHSSLFLIMSDQYIVRRVMIRLFY